MDILQFLQTIRAGGVLADMDEAMRDVIKGVDEAGKTGSLTLKISFAPSGDGQIMARDVISKVVPELPKRDTLFFFDGNFRPCRNDPRQLELRELRETGE